MTLLSIRERVAELHRDSLRRQLGRPVLEAARLAQDPGQPLSRYVLAQCELRGIDPAPYLAHIAAEEAC